MAFSACHRLFVLTRKAGSISVAKKGIGNRFDYFSGRFSRQFSNDRF
jgi:hypothetical protein